MGWKTCSSVHNRLVFPRLQLGYTEVCILRLSASARVRSYPTTGLTFRRKSMCVLSKALSEKYFLTFHGEQQTLWNAPETPLFTHLYISQLPTKSEPLATLQKSRLQLFPWRKSNLRGRNRVGEPYRPIITRSDPSKSLAQRHDCRTRTDIYCVEEAGSCSIPVSN